MANAIAGIILIATMFQGTAFSMGMSCTYCRYLCCQWSFSKATLSLPEKSISNDYAILLKSLKTHHGAVPCSRISPIWKNGEMSKEYVKCSWKQYDKCKRLKCKGYCIEDGITNGDRRRPWPPLGDISRPNDGSLVVRSPNDDQEAASFLLYVSPVQVDPPDLRLSHPEDAIVGGEHR